MISIKQNFSDHETYCMVESLISYFKQEYYQFCVDKCSVAVEFPSLEVLSSRFECLPIHVLDALSVLGDQGFDYNVQGKSKPIILKEKYVPPVSQVISMPAWLDRVLQKA